MSLLYKACFSLNFAMLSLALLPAQQGGGKPAAAAAPASTSGLAGLSYVRGDWSTSMPTDRKRVVLCYKLVPANSASQPFTLEPTRFDCNNNKADPVVRNACNVSKNSPCSIVDNTHPLLERQILVVAIDARNLAASLKDEELGKTDHPPVNISRMAVLNFNLTTQQGTALNPAPVRPSMSTASLATGNLGPSILLSSLAHTAYGRHNSNVDREHRLCRTSTGRFLVSIDGVFRRQCRHASSWQRTLLHGSKRGYVRIWTSIYDCDTCHG